MNCPKCGKTIPDGSKFCTGCGNKLLSAKKPAPAPDKKISPSKPVSTPAGTLSSQVIVPASIANPPPLPQKESLPDHDTKFYKSNNRGNFDPIFREWVFKPYMAVILVILAVSGAWSTHWISNFNQGEALSGLYSNKNYNYSMIFPEGWNINSNPTSKTGSYNAIGYFFKGDKRKPDIFMSLYYSDPVDNVPLFFSDNDLDAIESTFKDYITKSMKSMGREYEFLQFMSFVIDGRDALWVEGNIKEKRNKKRNFLFLTFEESKTYTIEFIFEEKRTEELWPEIEDILYSIEFE